MPYRTQRDALWSRKVELEQDEARIRRGQNTLGREALDVERELRDVRKHLRELTGPSSLDNIRVAAPCSAKWEDMLGDARARHCGSCNKTVFNLSAMTQSEAEAFLAMQTDAPCIRYFQRADGTMMTADCPAGVRRRRLQLFAAAAASAVAGLAGVACATQNATLGTMVPAEMPSGVERCGVSGICDTKGAGPMNNPAWVAPVATGSSPITPPLPGPALSAPERHFPERRD
jgi:hypothetical protein